MNQHAALTPVGGCALNYCVWVSPKCVGGLKPYKYIISHWSHLLTLINELHPQ
jgi:hypothetical protein